MATVQKQVPPSLDDLVKQRDGLIQESRQLSQRIKEIQRAIDVYARLPNPSNLTERQEQVLEMVRMGHPNKVIAIDLGITERTAVFHVGRLLRKFNVTSRRDLM